MPDTKITVLTAISTVDPAVDVLPIVDVSDTTMAASGTTKKITSNQILGAGGTATLASATITGDLTVSAGTVNGVGYLNASKVLTAGSALVFDGTNLGVGGTGQLRFATSGGAIGDNSIGTENSFSMMLRCGRGSTSNIELASDKLVFGTAASERYKIDSTGVATWSNVGGVAGTAMTLNSTGLGVGGGIFSSSKLTLVSGAGVDCMLALQKTGGSFTSVLMTDGANGWLGSSSGSTGKKLIYALNAPDSSLTIDTSGNVGIGVTPSAWFSNYKALQVNATASVSGFSSGSNQNTRIANNWFSNAAGTDTYIQSNFATVYQQNQGVHSWLTAPSGTAGNAITFTQSMTLDASGRLIINSSTFIPPTLNTNGELNFIATSNTNVRFSYRGTDGVTRVANITLA